MKSLESDPTLLSSREVVSANLNELMEKHKDNSYSLSERAGISRSGIQQIKAGQRGPGTNIIDQIARAYGIEPWRLFAPNLGRDIQWTEMNLDRARDVLEAIFDAHSISGDIPAAEVAELLAFFYQTPPDSAVEDLRRTLRAAELVSRLRARSQ